MRGHLDPCEEGAESAGLNFRHWGKLKQANLFRNAVFRRSTSAQYKSAVVEGGSGFNGFRTIKRGFWRGI